MRRSTAGTFGKRNRRSTVFATTQLIMTAAASRRRGRGSIQRGRRITSRERRRPRSTMIWCCCFSIHHHCCCSLVGDASRRAKRIGGQLLIHQTLSKVHKTRPLRGCTFFNKLSNQNNDNHKDMRSSLSPLENDYKQKGNPKKYRTNAILHQKSKQMEMTVALLRCRSFVSCVSPSLSS